MEAYAIISNYVTFGEVKAGQFDEEFIRLESLLPRPANEMKLYRVLRLDRGQVAMLDKHLILEHRTFTSWTKDYDSALKLASNKRGNDFVVITERTIPAEQIVVDVREFYETNGFKGMPEYWRYVEPESEVIVRYDRPMTLSKQNTTIVPGIHPPRPRPK